MWILHVLLLVGFSSVLGRKNEIDNRIKQCGRNSPAFDRESFLQASNDEQIQVLCSLALNYTNCVASSLENFGGTLEEIANLVVENDKGLAQHLTNIARMKNVSREACTEGAELNTELKADWQCFKGTVLTGNLLRPCEWEAMNVYAAFRREANKTEEEDDIRPPCMIAAYQAACVAAKIHGICGQRAFNTFDTMVKRIFPIEMCSKKQLEVLKTTYVDGLPMSETERNLFKLTLDLKS